MGIFERDMNDYKPKKTKKIKKAKTKYIVIKGKAYPLAKSEKIKKKKIIKKKIKKPLTAREKAVAFFKNAGRQSLMR